MRWILVFGLALPLAVISPRISAQTRKHFSENPSTPHPPIPEPTSLKICLRLEDGSPFSDVADLHVRAGEGSEIPGVSTKSAGEMIFPDLPPGSYVAEASAPGFVKVTQEVEIESGQSLVTLLLTMEPIETSDAASKTLAFLTTNDANANDFFWILPGGAEQEISAKGLFAPALPPLPLVRPASLKICLRLQDGFPYSGSADVRLLSTQGSGIDADKSESGSEVTFSRIRPGNYAVEASAPGFVPLERDIQIESGESLKTLFLVMEPPTSTFSFSGLQSYSRPDGPNPKQFSWIGPNATDTVPKVAPDVHCSLPEVLRGAGWRMREFVNNLDRFSALEHVDHFRVNKKGKRDTRPDSRSFDYLVSVTRNSTGLFQLEEYRNGSLSPSQFPEGIATVGLPGMALIFHPMIASDFDFNCEGLGEWAGRPAWEVYFEQRKDRPVRIREYVIDDKPFPVSLKGRAWIDAGTFEVLRLESDLDASIKKIRLAEEHLSIEYAAVQFRSDNTHLWLPKTADIYVEQNKHRYYRSHTYNKFRLFSVGADQSIEPAPDSYCFTNTSDRDISGVLTVSPAPQRDFNLQPIGFTIAAGNRVCKIVGSGKDVSIPVESIASAKFAHDGPEGSVKVDASFTNETTLDIVSESPAAAH